MVKLQNFAIEFESPYGVCHAGQPVIGSVCIQLSDSTNVTGEQRSASCWRFPVSSALCWEL